MSIASSSDDPPGDPLEHLVVEWMSLDETADILGTTPSRVRQLVREHALVAVRTVGTRDPRIPRLLVQGGLVIKGLTGTLTLLADAGYDPREAVGWLFTADDSLAGRPVDALRAHRVHEVRRRAQALGF